MDYTIILLRLVLLLLQVNLILDLTPYGGQIGRLGPLAILSILSLV
jgi:hypothetical protein